MTVGGAVAAVGGIVGTVTVAGGGGAGSVVETIDGVAGAEEGAWSTRGIVDAVVLAGGDVTGATGTIVAIAGFGTVLSGTLDVRVGAATSA